MNNMRGASAARGFLAFYALHKNNLRIPIAFFGSCGIMGAGKTGPEFRDDFSDLHGWTSLWGGNIPIDTFQEKD